MMTFAQLLRRWLRSVSEFAKAYSTSIIYSRQKKRVGPPQQPGVRQPGIVHLPTTSPTTTAHHAHEVVG